MKPNDKAIEAAFAAAEAHIGNTSQREWLREILTAAYAAQFQSGDYAGLVKELRERAGSYDSHDYHEEIELKAADAIEAVLVEREAWKGRQEATAEILKQVETERDALKAELAEAKDLSWFWEIVDAAGLNNVASCEQTALRELVKYAAERDALKGIVQRYQKLNKVQLNIRGDLKSERDALAARLAPVEDEELVEIVAKVLQDGYYELEWSVLPEEWKKDWRRKGRAIIAAIRPHIEAEEREKLQKMLARMGAGTTKTGAVNE